jgi:hypothetical protein
MAFPQQPALRCPKNEAHGVMEELTPIIEKDSEGVERFKKTVWECRVPNCEGTSEIVEAK